MKIHSQPQPSLLFAVLLAVLVTLCTWLVIQSLNPELPDVTRENASKHILTQGDSGTPSSTLMKKARSSYYQQMLRDPSTGRIPNHIRQKELRFAKQLLKQQQAASKFKSSVAFAWYEAGPNDVGGRTRALAVDRTNSDVILTGGVAGGIWKSTDGGTTWNLKSTPEALHHVTFITQDPRDNQNNRWFATTGEFTGSNGDRGQTAPQYGQGLYMSTNNGEDWQRIAEAGNGTTLDSPFDIGLKVLVSPTSGALLVASQAFGLHRMASESAQPQQVLGNEIFPLWTDVDIASNGTLIAATSAGLFDSNVETPGVFYSSDDGITWTDITPTNYPANAGRAVTAFAPSDPSRAYVWVYTDVAASSRKTAMAEQMYFFTFSLPSGTSEDRSANLPDFGAPVGEMDTQGGYDMVIAVKPNDPNHVFLGGTNLYRSRDGFATPANSKGQNWIGGYATVNNISQYTNHHPDQHALFFDPQNPDALWSGHDGGLSYVADISTTSSVIPWEDRNTGYNVTQFYHVSISQEANDDRILGGTQDNGSPFFRFDPGSQTTSASRDLSSGDGGYAYLGQSYGMASNQLGALLTLNYNASGTPLFAEEITPPNAQNQLFINPLAVDRLDESVVYYPGGNTLWQGTSVPVSPSWSAFQNTNVPSGYIFSALETGARSLQGSADQSVLYLGAYSPSDVPRLYRIDAPITTASTPTVITIPGAPSGAYIHGIAANPENGNEILVVMSNYNITGLYHSIDAGMTLTAVEGNLTGDSENPGPSLRSATILPLSSETMYILGTSTGVYSTASLAGNGTSWAQEAAAVTGNAIVEHVTSRASDGVVVAATHGRGIFVGATETFVSSVDTPDTLPRAATLGQNYPNPFSEQTSIAFSLEEPGITTLHLYDMQGRLVETLISERTRGAGSHSFQLDAGTLPSGTYIYELSVVPLQSSGSIFRESKALIVLK